MNPLVYWREMYYAKYNSLLDTLRMSDSLDIEDPVVAANYLINKLPDKWHYYTSTTPYSFGHIGPEYVQYLSERVVNVVMICCISISGIGNSLCY